MLSVATPADEPEEPDCANTEYPALDKRTKDMIKAAKYFFTKIIRTHLKIFVKRYAKM